MAVTQKRLLQNSVTGGRTFTATQKTIVTSIYLMNRNIQTEIIDIQIVPSGQTASDAHLIYNNIQLVQDGTFSLSNLDFVLEIGDAIRITNSGTLNTFIFGVEIT